MGRNRVYGAWSSGQTAWFINQSKAEKQALKSDLSGYGCGEVAWLLDIFIGQSAPALQIKMSNGYAAIPDDPEIRAYCPNKYIVPIRAPSSNCKKPIDSI